MSLSKSVNLEHAQTAVPCNVCEDEAPGEYYCIECKQTLCSQCEKYHRRSALSKGHNVVLRTQIGDVDTTVLSCTDHGDQASFHCEKCNVSVCSKCITGKHKGHALSELSTSFDKEKKLLQNDITRMQTENLDLKKRLDAIITAMETYEEKIDKINKDMEDENQALHRELDKRHEERIKNLVSIRDSQVATFDGYSKEIKTKINLYEERISEYQDAIGKNTLPALINFTRGKQSLPGIGKVKPLKLTTPTVVSKFKDPLQGLPSICITKDGDVWLAADRSKEILLVNIKGQVLRRRRVQISSYAMAVMDYGDIIISPDPMDSRSVSRLLDDDTEINVFDTSPSYSNGVSVTADQKILICTGDGRVVRTNGVGTNIEEIYEGSGVDSVIHAVENVDGTIYISDYTNSAVVMISKHGKVLSKITHTIGGQTLGRPWGLVVDKMGNVLCAYRDNHCVYIIDQDQQMRELVGRSIGIQNPCWLAVDGCNNLWITQRDGTVQVIKYYSP